MDYKIINYRPDVLSDLDRTHYVVVSVRHDEAVARFVTRGAAEAFQSAVEGLSLATVRRMMNGMTQL